MPRPHQSAPFRAFTLIELLIVLALLGIMMGMVAPTISRSMRRSQLRREALQIVAATELCRSFAVAEGIPMLFWVDTATSHYGMEPKAGFESGRLVQRDFELGEKVWIDQVTQSQGRQTADTTIEFAPDGAPDVAAIETIRLADGYGRTATVRRADDGWSYELAPEEEQP